MSTSLLTTIVVIIVALVALILAARRSGPRVTHIETRPDRDSGE